MATADTRSGFRLPWSSDRSRDDDDHAESAEAAPETASDLDQTGSPAWPESDFAATIGLTPIAPQPAEELAMTQQVAMPAPAPQVARKPTKLMADLTAAILATTETARDQALATVDADSTQVTEAIRAASTGGAEAIRRRSEGDLAAIKEWSKAEIARIREETEAKIGARKATLESELASHAAAVERRVAEVENTVAQYRSDMDLYFGNLATEDDPARLATMAEAMPEPPELDALASLADMDVTGFAPVEVVEPDVMTPEPDVEVEPEVEVIAEVEPFDGSEAFDGSEPVDEVEPDDRIAELLECVDDGPPDTPGRTRDHCHPGPDSPCVHVASSKRRMAASIRSTASAGVSERTSTEWIASQPAASSSGKRSRAGYVII